MSQKELDDQYSLGEIARRRDEAIKRALNTPPKPHSEMIGAKKKKATAKSTSKNE